jgi:hypothetical protein
MTIHSTDLPALRQQLAERQQDEMRVQVATLLESDEVRILALRAEAIAKQTSASVLFDEADRMEHAVALRKAVDGLSSRTAEAARTAEELDHAVQEAAERAEAARSRADRASATLTQATADEELARKVRAEPEMLIDLLARVNAAREVASREEQAARRAADEHVQAASCATAAHQVLHTLRMELDRARSALDSADQTAPVSAFTLARDWTGRLGDFATMQRPSQAVVRLLVAACAQATGVDREFKNIEADRIAKAEADRINNSGVFLPKPGHPLRPVNPGVRSIPVLPTS